MIRAAFFNHFRVYIYSAHPNHMSENTDAHERELCDQCAMSVTERLNNASETIESYKTCVREILLTGIQIAHDKIESTEGESHGDSDECYKFFLACYGSTFEFVDTADEKDISQHAFSILLYVVEIRDELIDLIVMNAVTREMISQLGDEDGVKSDMISKIRMHAREFVKQYMGPVETDAFEALTITPTTDSQICIQ
jgi:hypothetical protein